MKLLPLTNTEIYIEINKIPSLQRKTVMNFINYTQNVVQIVTVMDLFVKTFKQKIYLQGR